MKRIILLFAIVISFSAQAQMGDYKWFSKDKVPHYKNDRRSEFNAYKILDDGRELNGFMPGYYIDKNGKKIEGEIQYNYPFIMERIVVFRGNGSTTFLQPRDIKAYFVDGILRESVTANMSLMASMKVLETYFMIPEIKGKISYYAFSGENPTEMEDNVDLSQWGNYWTAYSAYDRMRESEIQKFTPKTRLIQKEGEPAIGTDALVMSFAKRVSAMMEDCPEVSARVKGKEKGYKSGDLEKIISEYNACVEE